MIYGEDINIYKEGVINIIEFHGWIVIRESQGSLFAEIEKRIENYYYYDNWCINLQNMYQSNQLIVSGETSDEEKNEGESIIELFKHISVIAPYSYGLLYVREHEKGNNFKVYKVAKGDFQEKKDHFFRSFG